MEEKIRFVTDINEIPNNDTISNYDMLQAKCQLINFGRIYLDEYGCPMEVEEVDYMLINRTKDEAIKEGWE